MKLFKKIFGGAEPPLEQLRRAVKQKRWADALALGESLEKSGIGPEEAAEMDLLLVSAGDELAQLNLEEGEACLRAREKAKAIEHFSLASAQARSEELARRAAEALKAVDQVVTRPVSPPPETTSCETHGCATCVPPSLPVEEPSHFPSDLDPQTRLELILASYPQDWAERYRMTGERFLEAFLLAHEGREKEALDSFERVPAEERGELFYFERGALLGRLGEPEKGIADLEQALALDPANPLALDTLVSLEMSNGKEAEAEKRLRQLLDQNVFPAFCNSRLALILAGREDSEAALEHGLRALDQGSDDAETLLLTANLLEERNRLEEAEMFLSRLSSGGCGGGAHVLLAEFWLRRKKNLDQALESFKGALRQEGDNPRWRLRIAQAYMTRGWKREGLPMLEDLVSDPRLAPTLREEALAQLRGEE
jgi:tetratricopeptide (TPR) repeat protein